MESRLLLCSNTILKKRYGFIYFFKFLNLSWTIVICSRLPLALHSLVWTLGGSASHLKLKDIRTRRRIGTSSILWLLHKMVAYCVYHLGQLPSVLALVYQILYYIKITRTYFYGCENGLTVFVYHWLVQPFFMLASSTVARWPNRRESTVTYQFVRWWAWSIKPIL